MLAYLRICRVMMLLAVLITSSRCLCMWLILALCLPGETKFEASGMAFVNDTYHVVFDRWDQACRPAGTVHMHALAGAEQVAAQLKCHTGARGSTTYKPHREPNCSQCSTNKASCRLPSNDLQPPQAAHDQSSIVAHDSLHLTWTPLQPPVLK